jgi:hypothetical protein
MHDARGAQICHGDLPLRRTDGVVSEVFNHGAGGNNKKLFHCHFRHCVAAVAAAAATEEAWSGLGIG